MKTNFVLASFDFRLSFNIRKIAIAGGSFVGVGALSLYGLGLIFNQPGSVYQMVGSAAIALASTAAVMRSPRVMDLITTNRIVNVIALYIFRLIVHLC